MIFLLKNILYIKRRIIISSLTFGKFTFFGRHFTKHVTGHLRMYYEWLKKLPMPNIRIHFSAKIATLFLDAFCDKT